MNRPLQGWMSPAILLLAGWVFGRWFGLTVASLGVITARRHGGSAPAGAACGMLCVAAIATAYARQPLSDVSVRYAVGRPVAANAALASAVLLAVAVVNLSQAEMRGPKSSDH